MPKEAHKEHKEAVKDYQFTEQMSVDELVNQMDKAWGFTAGKLAVGVNIMESMINTKGCVKFLSFHRRHSGHWHARRNQGTG